MKGTHIHEESHTQLHARTHARTRARARAHTHTQMTQHTQARRTRSSSPLGQLFDHGCDALSVHLLMGNIQV